MQSTGPVVNPTARPRVVRHGGMHGCGERIPSPHAACQAWAAPYNAAEIVTTTGPARVRVSWLICHGCGRRESVTA